MERMSFERSVLAQYLDRGKLAQVATLDKTGTPAVCNVWYDFTIEPDRLVFMSRRDRDHSENIRNNARVAGSIVAIPFEGLGDRVQGLTFKGNASELDPSDHPETAHHFIDRWSNARPPLTSPGQMRLYEIAVTEWQLFDEVNFPEEPKRIIIPR